MIVMNKQRTNNLLVCALALMAVLASIVYVSNGPSASTGIEQPTTFRRATRAETKVPDAPMPVAKSADGIKRPIDIGPQEWQDLVDALRDHPQRDQELTRLVGYTRFKRDMDQWAALENQPNTRERAQVGQRIVDALPTRLVNREVTGPEALMIQSAIYAELIPDVAQRKSAENAAREALRRVMAQDAATDANLTAETAQTANYKKREATITERFRDQQINQEQMEKDLDAARTEVFR
jgi:hypothetical protein